MDGSHLLGDRLAARVRAGNREEPATTLQEQPIEYSYWRVWIEDDQVRVARDWFRAPKPGPQLQPQHLEESGGGYIAWHPHDQGASIPSISLHAFIAWLDQGGAAT